MWLAFETILRQHRTVSKRLGHAQVSTAANIYAHFTEEADQRNADILANIFLKKA